MFRPSPPAHFDLGLAMWNNGLMADAITQIDPSLLDILVCPLTRSALRQDGDELVAARPEGAGLRYPIREGIPILLVDEAKLPPGVASLDEFRRKYVECIPR